MVDEPIGHAIAGAVANDLLRGVIATDALIGTFSPHARTVADGNICCITWSVGAPESGTFNRRRRVGDSATAAAATAPVVTSANVFRLDPDGTVRYHSDSSDGAEHLVRGRFVLVGSHRRAGPACSVNRLRHWPRTQVKVQHGVRRLPGGCATTVSAVAAGTFRIQRTWSGCRQLLASSQQV